jgi:hypothetical protein
MKRAGLDPGPLSFISKCDADQGVRTMVVVGAGAT